ncbi:C2H2-type zinc finger protein [Sporobolomyces koalae]|uniref:C2H2-type zinc finger protein n=1 Tax=Sporobolomyces koalae TaxID=500713 RepID=UPI00317AE34D
MSSASLKSLMKAKKQSARLTHPHARYSSAGQLSCSLCGIQLKSEALWGSHLVSKQHRVAAQAAERQQQQQQTHKRKSRSPSPGPNSKRPRADAGPSLDTASPSITSPPQADRASEGRTPSAPVAVPEEDPSIDEFLPTLSNDTPASSSTAQATISAAPIKFEFGAPKVRTHGEEGDEDVEGEANDVEPEETEDERRDRLEQEEREEMMARLEEEEREQKEADEKVTALKRRLELMRQAKKNKQP